MKFFIEKKKLNTKTKKTKTKEICPMGSMLLQVENYGGNSKTISGISKILDLCANKVKLVSNM